MGDQLPAPVNLGIPAPRDGTAVPDVSKEEQLVAVNGFLRELVQDSEIQDRMKEKGLREVPLHVENTRSGKELVLLSMDKWGVLLVREYHAIHNYQTALAAYKLVDLDEDVGTLRAHNPACDYLWRIPRPVLMDIHQHPTFDEGSTTFLCVSSTTSQLWPTGMKMAGFWEYGHLASVTSEMMQATMEKYLSE